MRGCAVNSKCSSNNPSPLSKRFAHPNRFPAVRSVVEEVSVPAAEITVRGIWHPVSAKVEDVARVHRGRCRDGTELDPKSRTVFVWPMIESGIDGRIPAILEYPYCQPPNRRSLLDN